MSSEVHTARAAAGDQRVPWELLRDFIVRVLVKKSVFQYDAQTVAARLIEADLRGLSGCGVAMLPQWLEALDQGDIDPRGRVLVEQEAPALAVLDGSRALGPVAAVKAMQTVVAKARDMGVAAAVVHHGHSLGAPGVYALLAAEAGMIGFCTSSSGCAQIGPAAAAPLIANAVSAWAIPTGSDRPIVINLGCGSISSADIALLSALGLPLPEAAALDERGAPTTDPAAARSIAPAGGGLGFGLGLVGMLLSSGLAGGKLASQKKRSLSSECAEHFCLALDVAHFTSADRFFEQAAALRQAAAALPLAPGEEPALLPGDRDWREFDSRQATGVPIAPALLDRLAQCAVRLKIETPWDHRP